jgi:hypothetical protein
MQRKRIVRSNVTALLTALARRARESHHSLPTAEPFGLESTVADLVHGGGALRCRTSDQRGHREGTSSGRHVCA